MFFEREKIQLRNQKFFDWTTSDNPRIKYYSGRCRYTASFKVDGYKQKQWMLCLPKVNGNVNVFVNGQEVGVLWCSPWKLDVSKYLKNGVNKLELFVDNVLSNRMIGDAGLPVSERVTFCQPQIYENNDLLKPSGIFGAPVQLESYR